MGIPNAVQVGMEGIGEFQSGGGVVEAGILHGACSRDPSDWMMLHILQAGGEAHPARLDAMYARD